MKCYQVYLKNKAVDGSNGYGVDGKNIMDISDADLKGIHRNIFIFMDT